MTPWRKAREKVIAAAFEAGVSAGLSNAWNSNIERGFIDRDGIDKHMPSPLTYDGEGPATGDLFHHMGCWCGDPDCVWAKALADERRDGYVLGFKVGQGPLHPDNR